MKNIVYLYIHELCFKIYGKRALFVQYVSKCYNFPEPKYLDLKINDFYFNQPVMAE